MTRLQERYLAGARSLKIDTIHDQADHIPAVAWAGDSLGRLLWRLQGEWDSVRGEMYRREHLQPIDRALILMRLRSLAPAKIALIRWADIQATRRRVMVPTPVVAAICGRVLDVWLDPTCHVCTGRGFSGGSHRGERQVICRSCGGSGHRRHTLGQGREQIAFGEWMLSAIGAKLARFERAARSRIG